MGKDQQITPKQNHFANYAEVALAKIGKAILSHLAGRQCFKHCSNYIRPDQSTEFSVSRETGDNT